MKFKSLEIKNFRNYDEIHIELDNKNVIFGMNDIGKTNFLYAIRFLLDKNIRKEGFQQTDYHKNNLEKDIVITLEIDISDFDESEDSKKLVAEAAGVRSSANMNTFFIRVVGAYNSKDMIGESKLFWGDDIENLVEMASSGYNFRVDNIFHVEYINPLMDLNSLFLKNKRFLFDENSSSDDDKVIIEEIKDLTNKVNDKIGILSSISSLESEITKEYNNLREENIEVEMKSEMAIKGFFSDIVPYIKKDGDENYYPTSGDGRRKILSYSMINLINKRRYEDKVVIYLIEEPENSLHRSMQIALSKQLFSQTEFNYSFISTHSADILYELDDAMLIRVYSKDKIECSSHLYKLSNDFKKDKKKLNKLFCNALFSERVLLVEGPSEYVLFEKVMGEVNDKYELDGGYILQVNGTYFKTYFDAFKGLNIDIIVKTDNDLKKRKKSKKGSNDEETLNKEYELLGVNRCLKLINRDNMPNITISFSNNRKDSINNKIKEERKRIYEENKDLIREFEKNKIYLSELDLENDLSKEIGEKIASTLGVSVDDAVKTLQSSKLYNMVDLVENLSKEDCVKIYNSKYFKCLKELNNDR